MSPTFVLVPGAGGEARYWHLVVDRLTRRGVGARAVELPGPDPDVGMDGYVRIVRHEVRRGRGEVVLVGQSMGGFTAAWVAAVEPVAELVLLNAMIPLPGETPEQWWDSTDQAGALRVADLESGRDPEGPFDLRARFLHDVPLEALAGAGDERPESDAVSHDPWGPESWPDVTTRVLVGADDRLFPADFQERVAWQRLALPVERVPGGHLAALSQPEAVTAALLRPYR